MSPRNASFDLVRFWAGRKVAIQATAALAFYGVFFCRNHMGHNNVRFYRFYSSGLLCGF